MYFNPTKLQFAPLGKFLSAISIIALALSGPVSASPRENVLKPYDGPSISGSDPATLKGKVMTGYQGWFNCKGDGANLGWTHWSRNSRGFGPGNVTVDLWPDVSEYDDDLLYETGFRFTDGSKAKTFSSHDRKTVLRHFKWMRDYGIDGAFVQRFTHSLHDPTKRYHKDKVLSSAREGANRYGRTYTLMYDLTGTQDKAVLSVFDDWKMLREKMQITKDPAFQHHEGKPLVAIWGVGFNDGVKRRPSLKECSQLIRKLKEDGCSVMLGTPTGWREQDRDALKDPDLHRVLLMADILSPWTIGRFRTLDGVAKHAKNYWAKDLEWTAKNDLGYMPVIFPGFSWHNLQGDKLDSIPRLNGRFMWSQIVASKKAGAEMIYIAMFDEVDEATAIFKCTDQPPTGEKVKFLTMEGLPSDFYLRLSGEAGKLLRDEIPLTESLPAALDGLVGEESGEVTRTWLRGETQRQLAGSRVQSSSGVWLQTPDGVGHYKALWTRDYYYQYRYAGEFFNNDDVKAAIGFLLDGQRADGCIPDRVRADGQAVYSPGGLGNPMADHAVDNGPFMAMLVCEYLRRSGDLESFKSIEAKLRKGMDFIKRSETGLVYNSPDKPECVYGFTDIVTKTGNLLFTSLLYHKACEDLASWCEKSGAGDARTYRKRADLIRKNIDLLWNEEAGMFWAADQDCKQVDIWGSAYAVDVGLTTDKQSNRIIDYLLKHEDVIVQRGQIRHLPGKGVWDRLFKDSYPPGTYQNGAYWATPLAWVIPVVGQREPDTAWKWVREAIDDSRKNGLAECLNGETRKVSNFVVSATNLYYATRWLEKNAPKQTK